MDFVCVVSEHSLALYSTCILFYSGLSMTFLALRSDNFIIGLTNCAYMWFSGHSFPRSNVKVRGVKFPQIRILFWGRE